MTWILFSLSFFNADSKYVDSHGNGIGNVIYFFRSDSRLNIYNDDIIILSGKGAGPTIPLPFPIKKN